MSRLHDQLFDGYHRYSSKNALLGCRCALGDTFLIDKPDCIHLKHKVRRRAADKLEMKHIIRRGLVSQVCKAIHGSTDEPTVHKQLHSKKGYHTVYKL